MNNIKKSKIFWTNIIAFVIALLGLINPELLAALGCENNGKFLTYVGLLSAVLSIIFRTFFNTPYTDPTLKIGGRPRRKKPTAILSDTTFRFSGTDIADTDSVFYTHTSYPDLENPAEIASLAYTHEPGAESTVVTFTEPIPGDIHDLTFYFS